MSQIAQIPGQVMQQRQQAQDMERQQQELARRARMDEERLALDKNRDARAAAEQEETKDLNVLTLHKMRKAMIAEEADQIQASGDLAAVRPWIERRRGKFFDDDEADTLLAQPPDRVLKGLASVREPKPAEPFTLGNDQVRFSGTGQELARGPVTPPKPVEPKLETRGLDVQAADALARGDQATYDRLMKVKKEMGQADDRPRITVNTGAGLPASLQRRVDVKSKAFESLPLVKRAQMSAESVGFANSLDVNTKNPADDQGLIYAFAKAMDPDSVVREGEYATVQKYAQSWAESFGFNAARIFSNTTFLTAQARQNMKATIAAKFKASEGQYNNARQSYVKQINQITGQDNGEEYLTDFGGAFPGREQPAGGAAPPAASASAGPKVGEMRTANGETRRWTGKEWEPVK